MMMYTHTCIIIFGFMFLHLYLQTVFACTECEIRETEEEMEVLVRSRARGIYGI